MIFQLLGVDEREQQQPINVLLVALDPHQLDDVIENVQNLLLIIIILVGLADAAFDHLLGLVLGRVIREEVVDQVRLPVFLSTLDLFLDIFLPLPVPLLVPEGLFGLGRALEALPDQLVDAIESDLTHEMERRRGSEGVHLTGAGWLVTASRRRCA